MPEDRHAQDPAVQPPPASHDEARYANALERLGAALIDSAIFLVIVWLLQTAMGVDGLLPPRLLALGAGGLLGGFYYTFFEGSRTGATIGKQVFGLRVTDQRFDGIGVGVAALRYLGRLVSSLTLGLGFIGAATSPRGRTLHDVLAGTVVRKDRAGLSVAARVILVAVAMFVTALPIFGTTLSDGEDDCGSIPSASKDAANRKRIPETVPIPEDMRVMWVAREGRRVTLGARWQLEVDQAYARYLTSLPATYVLEDGTFTTEQGTFRFAGADMSAMVSISPCAFGSSIFVDAKTGLIGVL